MHEFQERRWLWEWKTQGKQGKDITRTMSSQLGLRWQLDQNLELLSLGTRAAHECRHSSLWEVLKGKVCFRKTYLSNFSFSPPTH